MCPSTDKEDMVHIHNGILLNHRKTTILGHLWMDLESILQSEASQKEKNGYHILIHTHGT